MAICPCKDCGVGTGRKVGCHSTCDDYLEWRKEHDLVKKVEREEKDFARVLRTAGQLKRWSKPIRSR